MDNKNPVPQPSTSAQAKENDKKSNQDQESKPTEKPQRDEINFSSISPVLAVTPAGNEIGNKFSIYGLHYTVRQFSKLGSKEDLKLLRCLSKDYYKELNSIYWDEAPHCMRFGLFGDGPHIYKMDNDHESAEYSEELLFDNRSEIEKIVHTFRALIVHKFADLDSTQSDLITLISPHIEHLKFDLNESDEFIRAKKCPPQKHIKIMEQFTNLKSCKIEYYYFTLEEIEMILRRFSPYIEFEISTFVELGKINKTKKYKKILDKLGGIPNVCWTIDIYTYSMLEEMRTIYDPLFGKWPNLDIIFDIRSWTTNLDELRTTTQICLYYQDKIKNKLDLHLYFTNVPDQDKEALKICLGALRSFVTRLELDCETKDWNIDIGDETWSWPKFTELDIHIRFDTSGGNIPFVIMKNSPNLQHFYLSGTGDPRSIIVFKNQEYIRQFFGGLTKLKMLRVRSKSDLLWENKVEFRAYLKQHLPGMEIEVSKLY